MSRKTVAVVGTVDTKKGTGFFLRERIQEHGLNCLLINVSGLPSKSSSEEIDITQEEIAEAVDSSMEEIQKMEKAEAARMMAKGLAMVIRVLYESGKIQGVLGFGGSWGISVIVPAIMQLPIGFPKQITTTALRNLDKLIGAKDIVVSPSITDFGGDSVNSIEAKILSKVAGSMVGMVEAKEISLKGKTTILATQMGVTTSCVNSCKAWFEKRGEFEVVPFHAIGTGGDTFESLIAGDFADGVLDVTLAEISNELLGGSCITGPHRLSSAGKKGVPQIVVPGALDMCNYPGPGTRNVPEKYQDREFYFHNPLVSLMRVNREESMELGRIVSERLNRALGPTFLVIPLGGWSDYDRSGGVETVDYGGNPTGRTWYKPECDNAFVATIEKHLDISKRNIKIAKVDLHINDLAFAELISGLLYEIMRQRGKEGFDHKLIDP
jgi:uncharacterized protein (UPF0261 family)